MAALPPLDKVTAGDFKPYEGKRFSIVLGKSRDTLVLNSIDESRFDPPPNKRKAFSLLFTGGPNTALRQDKYTLDNEGTGPFEVFLVPVGTVGSAMAQHGSTGTLRYQVVFN